MLKNKKVNIVVVFFGGDFMLDNKKLKVINFLQDFGCARIDQIQKIYGNENSNFKNILEGNLVSKKGNVFIHNTKKIDEKMIIALDILCKYKNRYVKFYQGYDPVLISFLSKEKLLYHIIVADEENEKGIVKLVNSYPLSIPKADKLILAFPNEKELENINCEIPFLYTTYPNFKVINE